MYHRVTPTTAGRFPPTYNVSPHRFEQQLTSLLRRGFECWSIERILTALREKESLPPRVFGITFDDGYENNFLYAFPVLKKLQLPATIFLATAYLDSKDPLPFDDWAQANSAASPESWRPLNYQQCDAMLASGVISLGAHTHTHADFRHAKEAFEADLAACCQVLRNRFGISRPAVTFPFGVPEMGFADRTFSDAAHRLGCSGAFQIGNRLVNRNDSLFNIPRFDVAAHETGATLAAKLDGRYERLTGWLRSGNNFVRRRSVLPSIS
jgi:peptidoglycan/xylan/chitin deacetylase (PgdA/CDA1 family)